LLFLLSARVSPARLGRFIVMVALDAAIHENTASQSNALILISMPECDGVAGAGVDGRHKAGHDGGGSHKARSP
jgi:hypothetical protein